MCPDTREPRSALGLELEHLLSLAGTLERGGETWTVDGAVVVRCPHTAVLSSRRSQKTTAVQLSFDRMVWLRLRYNVYFKMVQTRKNVPAHTTGARPTQSRPTPTHARLYLRPVAHIPHTARHDRACDDLPINRAGGARRAL